MKSESKYKSFSAVSLFVVTLYFLLNTVFVLEWINMQGTLSVFANAVFMMDLFTWHIYGAFAIISFIIKVIYSNKYSGKKVRLNIVLHFIFTVISLVEIYQMIQNGF